LNIVVPFRSLSYIINQSELKTGREKEEREKRGGEIREREREKKERRRR
jgi:hypothetical protein